jgi:signal transduction histidine kinase
MSADMHVDMLGPLRALLATAEPAACHAALADAARSLDAGATMAAAELARTPYGPVILWRTDEGPSDDALLAWFARAEPGRMAACRDGTGLVASSDDAWVAVICESLPPPEIETAMRDLAAAAAQHLGRLRRDGEMRRRRERLDSRDAEQAALLRAGADIVWQAGSDGILHVTQIFHDRRDLALKLEGRSLADLVAGDTTVQALTARGESLRARRVSLRGSHDSFALTCAPGDGGGLRGTIADDAPDRLAIDARTLETILDARQREEQLRRETETMMLGLRLLMGDLSYREKLEQLALHLACAIRCDDVRMVQHRPGEKPRLVLPEVPPLEDTLLLQRVLAHGDLRPVTILRSESDDAAFLRIALDMRAGDIVLVALPALSERHYLLCRARHGLSRGDQEVAERISLLLQQALILQGDQNRMIHTAKLSALGQMSTSIAHELRQPLNTISIAAQNLELMAEMENADPDVLREKAARIMSQIDRACKVMDRMRRFGRKTVGDREAGSLAAIVRSARSLMDTIAIEGGITLEIDVDDALQVVADELEIEQVLVNLIQNAADAIHERGPQGTIRIWAGDDPDRQDMLRLHVEDSGPGFPQDVLAHALDAFFTTKPEGKGTGLGLSIAHAILREHGGRLLLGNGEMGGQVILVLPRAADLIEFPQRSQA